ncbi:SCAN domain-containing protein [Tanacetum coccineum]
MGVLYVRPGATRFSTSYLTLCRLYELKGALISMFASEKWENSNFAKSHAGKNIESIVLDNVGFWRLVNTCCTAAIPLIKVLRMVDSDSPAMGFILEAMVNAKKEIKFMYKDVQSRYQPRTR